MVMEKDDILYLSSHSHLLNFPQGGGAYPVYEYIYKAALSNGQQFSAPFGLSIGSYKQPDPPNPPPIDEQGLTPFDGLGTFLQMGFQANDVDKTVVPTGFVHVAGQFMGIVPFTWGVAPWVVNDVDGDGRPESRRRR